MTRRHSYAYPAALLAAAVFVFVGILLLAESSR